MSIQRICFVLILMTILICGAIAAEPPTESAPADKALVVDGHAVHNLGRLSNHVTNWGLIGATPSRATSYSHAPSATWPDDTDDVYLWGAGLWVGGTVLGEPLVSTGQLEHEIMASPAAGDTIFSTSRGTPGGVRYPWPGADDDGDGQEDEDPLDGIDNDGDGLIDEDYGAIGDQSFVCNMSDNTLLALQTYPDHTPLNISVIQRSFQWAHPWAADFIGYEYTIKNIGVIAIEQVYCGLFSDFDIGSRLEPGIADDDMAGGWTGGLVRTHDGSFVPVSIGYMWDDAAVNGLSGWVGWVMCGLGTDAQAGLPGGSESLPTMQISSGSLPFAEGGDPTNDDERLQVLSSGTWDPNVRPGNSDDYRVTLATQPITTLRPGESMTFSVALVLGADLNELLGNAAEAVLTAGGKNFDRDGDPANGKEFHVPWLLSTEGLSAVLPDPPSSSLSLSAWPNPFNPRVVLSLEVTRPGLASVTIHDLRGRAVRTLLTDTYVAEATEVVWDGTDTGGRAVASGVYVVRLVVNNEAVERRISLIR